jgi:hypothetical protein
MNVSELHSTKRYDEIQWLPRSPGFMGLDVINMCVTVAHGFGITRWVHPMMVCNTKQRLRPHFHSFCVCWQYVVGQRARRGAAAVSRVRPRPAHAACTGAQRARAFTISMDYYSIVYLLSPAHKHVSYACPVCVCAFHNAPDSIREPFVYLHSTPHRFSQ